MSSIAPLHGTLDDLKAAFPTEAPYTDVRVVQFDVPVHPDVRTLLPLWMWPSSPPRATLQILDYRRISYAPPYREAMLYLHVRTPIGPGAQCAWSLVTEDAPLLSGRETLGFPKKLADIRFAEDGDHVRVAITRQGRPLLSLEATCGAADPAPPPVFDRRMYNVGGLGSWLFVNPVWALRSRERVNWAREAEVRLTLHASRSDPLAR
ncbi:MAG: acetoacetate decarboxylase family protein, partial [Myxococcota bacterium]